MRITATQIAEWAKTKEAQASLPRLVRRLVHTAGTPTEVDFPAGDSTGLPGWDGEVVSDHIWTIGELVDTALTAPKPAPTIPVPPTSTRPGPRGFQLRSSK